MEKEFVLKEREKKEKIKDGDEESKWNYTLKMKSDDDVILKVKGESTAEKYGLPTKLNDSVMVDFGKINEQTQIDDPE